MFFATLPDYVRFVFSLRHHLEVRTTDPCQNPKHWYRSSLPGDLWSQNVRPQANPLAGLPHYIYFFAALPDYTYLVFPVRHHPEERRSDPAKFPSTGIDQVCQGIIGTKMSAL
jgi:hypothetical protein